MQLLDIHAPQGSSWVRIHACTKDGNEYMNSRCTKYMHVAMAMGSIAQLVNNISQY